MLAVVVVVVVVVALLDFSLKLVFVESFCLRADVHMFMRACVQCLYDGNSNSAKDNIKKNKSKSIHKNVFITTFYRFRSLYSSQYNGKFSIHTKQYSERMGCPIFVEWIDKLRSLSTIHTYRLRCHTTASYSSLSVAVIKTRIATEIDEPNTVFFLKKKSTFMEIRTRNIFLCHLYSGNGQYCGLARVYRY